MSNYITAEAAVQLIKSGNRVFMQGGAATPVYLINSLLSRAEELQDVELTSTGTMKPC
jgi:acyl-CoA hydrolase